MAIRSVFALSAVAVWALPFSVQAAPLSDVEAVRLFLGIQPNSPVTVSSLETGGEDIVVKGLSAPLGAGKDAPRLTIETLQISGIVPGETTAAFGSILGSGVAVSGSSGLMAKSLMITDVQATELGVRPLSVSSVDNLLLGDVVIAEQARLESYSVSMTGSLTSSFSGSVKIQGIQTVGQVAPGLGDRFDVALLYKGDAPERRFDMTYSVNQSLLGTVDGEAHWSDVTFRSGTASPLSQFDLVATLRDAKLVSGTMALKPGPNGKMLLRALPPTKRDELAQLARKLIEQDGSVPHIASSGYSQSVSAFLAKPDRLSLKAAPAQPVAMETFSSVPSIQVLIDRLGLVLTPGE